MNLNLNPRKILFGNRNPNAPVLLAVTPPRTGERTLLGVENLLQSIAVPESFSLELAGDADGVTLLARCIDREVVRGQIAAHYPQARIQVAPPEDDPIRADAGEQAWAMTLRASGPEYVPLRTFRDDDLLDPGSDPLIAIIGALSNLGRGERVVARLLLRSMGPDWSQAYQQKALRQQQPGPSQNSQATQAQIHTKDGVTLAVLGVAALVGLRGYLWFQDGEILKASLLGLGTGLGLVAAGWGWWRWRRARNRVFDPLIIKEKVGRIAFDGEIQVVAVLPASDPKSGLRRAREVLEPVAAAYRHYDHPAGARFKASAVKPLAPTAANLHPAGPGLFGRRSVLGVREAAALWHPPGARDETPLLERSGSRVLLPSARGTSGGALVGDTTAGRPREIRFPEDLLRRHHFYVARTRMGKSTLMGHIVAHKLKEKAEGRDHDAIVVVDPHADLVKDLLAQVPESIADRVKLIDLADPSGAPGINLLDARVFADRDRTADSVVRIAHGLWDQWGPRMQSILEHTVKSLHEANRHPATSDDEQFTLLDGLPLLSDDNYRTGVLTRVSDPFLLDWWGGIFASWRRDYQGDALAPVQTRLSYYASSEKARAIIGQPRSTINLRETILEGGVLFVSTAQGKVGRDVAALVGASLLNLVDSVIREQESLDPDRRRGALVVVDEMQSIPGVDYESMLSELGKFGASFILATQSLGKLEDLSRTMRDTVLANVGCLAAFQMAGTDARQLVWELGKERVTEDDITSLPVHQCYVRATVGAERMPAFSMMVRKPEPGRPSVAQRIRDGASAYITPETEIAAQQERGRQRVQEWRREVERIRQSQNPPDQQQQQPAPKDLGRDGQRSKHFQPPTGGAKPDQAGEGDPNAAGESDAGEEQGDNLTEYRQLLIERQQAEADGEGDGI